jgi:hypothetical protein
MPAITSAGIGSGLDIEGIITGLMNAEKIPLNDLKTERNTIKSKISMYGQMTSAFDALKTASTLISKLTGLNPQKVSSSDDKIISATASESATAGQAAEYCGCGRKQRGQCGGHRQPDYHFGQLHQHPRQLYRQCQQDACHYQH